MDSETQRGSESPHQINVKNSYVTKDLYPPYLTQYPLGQVIQNEIPEVVNKGRSRKDDITDPCRTNVGNFRFMERKTVLLQAPRGAV